MEGILLKYQRDQKNGLSLSQVGLGCMRLTSFGGVPTDRNEGLKVIHEALDAGINFLNTGDFYSFGENELLVGEALQGHKREEAFVSVKFGALGDPSGRLYGIDSRPLTIKNYLTYSLKRLNLEYVDLYQPGRIDPSIPVEEVIGVMADLVKEGYVKHIGLSEVDAETLRRAHKVHPISLLEKEYSLLNRNVVEEELLPTARELGVGFIAYSVLSSGLLGGNVTKERLANDFRRQMRRFSGAYLDKNLNIVNALRQIANEKGITLAQLATAWVIAQGEDVVPLIGARNLAQFQDCIQSIDVEFTHDEIEKIDELVPRNYDSGPGFEPKIKNGYIEMP